VEDETFRGLVRVKGMSLFTWRKKRRELEGVEPSRGLTGCGHSCDGRRRCC